MKDIQKLLSEHIFAQTEEEKENYRQNPPQIAEKLEWFPNECVFSELSDKDKFQVLTRYLNDEGVYIKNILHFLLRCERLLTWIAEAEGVDVDAKFKQDAKAKEELIEKSIQESKDKLKNLKN